MKNVSVLYFGVPSIDHVCKLSDDTAHLRDYEQGHWKLCPESSFVFQRGQELLELHVGKKWGTDTSRLSLHEKATLTSQDRGFLTIHDPSQISWKALCTKPGAIPAHNYEMRISGPARTSIDALLKSPEFYGPLSPTDIDFVFLAGNDQASEIYKQSIYALNNSSSGSILPTMLCSDTWATHEAFHFQIERGGRTLIRYQECQQHFDPAIIADWFTSAQKRISEYDVLVINSLKNPYLIDAVAELASSFLGKVIVAPTDNMHENNPSATRALVQQRADVIICNMNEAALLTDKSYGTLLSNSDCREIVEKMLGFTNAKRVYISDEARPSWYANRLSGSTGEVGYFQTPPVHAINPWSAGDVWTGFILRDELGKCPDDISQTLERATLFASYYVSQPFSVPLTFQGYQQFVSQLPSLK